MAPSDFARILICGCPGPLPNDHPSLNPAYNPCAHCRTPTWRRCSKCGNVSYCSREHEHFHWHVHKRVCPAAPTLQHGHHIQQRKARIRPLKSYEVDPDEALRRVSSLYFGANYTGPQEVDVKYKPAGPCADGQPAGPWPVLGRYFNDDTPQCVLVEADGDHVLTEPLAIWFSSEALHSRRMANDAILSLFGPDERPNRHKHFWRGAVVVMKFTSWNYDDFAPVTYSDLPHVKMYFSNYVGVEEIW